jgi:acetoacetyl-CoA synthetase
MSEPNKALWVPSEEDIKKTNLYRFASAHGFVASETVDFVALHAWSINNPSKFWGSIWETAGILGDRGEIEFVPGDTLMDARFFPEARVNFAENLLRFQGNQPAIIASGEGSPREVWSRDDVRVAALKFAAWLQSQGIKKGDRVAAIVANIPEAVVVMLGASAIGAVFSSCSPDFGEVGILDRFSQIEPRILVAVDGYFYSKKPIDIRAKVKSVRAGLPSVEKLVTVPYGGLEPMEGALSWDDIQATKVSCDFEFQRFAFRDPLYIMFSSGTTGKPKCIVHCIGGVLLQHVKEHVLHCDIHEGDAMFYFTTCGWMMWNWLVTGLASGATLLLYDGSPFARGGRTLFEIAQNERATFLGLSAKFIDGLKKVEFNARDEYDLSHLRTIASTGSPLMPESFDYVYKNIKADVNLASIAGGTDLVSCFVLGNPCAPVWRGEIQAPGLGMAVEVWDDDGHRVKDKEGELVCTRAFPSMPIGFWNDPDHIKYKAAYFERFENVWCHGDFIVETVKSGYVMLGRSDATLNPQGVRIGTAEIYAQVEALADVVEAVAVGQSWGGDVRIILFVVLAEGVVLDEELAKDIRTAIKDGASPRHVPAKVLAVPDIPRTKSGKITELAVRDIIHGRPIKNTEALENPEALDHFKGLKELET